MIQISNRTKNMKFVSECETESKIYPQKTAAQN